MFALKAPGLVLFFSWLEIFWGKETRQKTVLQGFNPGLTGNAVRMLNPVFHKKIVAVIRQNSFLSRNLKHLPHSLTAIFTQINRVMRHI